MNPEIFKRILSIITLVLVSFRTSYRSDTKKIIQKLTSLAIDLGTGIIGFIIFLMIAGILAWLSCR